MMNEKKIVVLGDPKVGKTALILKLLENKFFDVYRPTIGVVIRKGCVFIGDVEVHAEFWDFSGKMKNSLEMFSEFLQNADGLLYMADITKEKSIKQLPSWFEPAREFLDSMKIPPILIILNKIDLIDDDKELIRSRISLVDETLENMSIDYKIIPLSVKKSINLNDEDLFRHILKLSIYR